MYIITFSKRLSDFVDAADVNGNIRNSRLNLQYLAQIDNACVKAGITTGAVYPMAGGVADSHKFNFLDPRNLDAAFRLQFFGSLTHSSLGIKGNSDIGGYANTFLIPSTHLILNNTHLSFYSADESFSTKGDADNELSAISHPEEISKITLSCGYGASKLAYSDMYNNNDGRLS